MQKLEIKKKEKTLYAQKTPAADGNKAKDSKSLHSDQKYSAYQA